MEKLNHIDDLMFRKMAEDLRFCEEILRIFLSDAKLIVTGANPQYALTNLQGRSVILDVKCILSDGRHVLIEVQKADDDDHQRRVRYNSSVLTANITDPGTRFKEVPDICSVFISRFDPFCGNLPRYHILRSVKELETVADNGTEEIYVNAKINDGSDVAQLMELFVKGDVYNDKFPVTSGIKRRLKKTEEGRRTMNESLRRLIEEERNESRNEGKAEGKLEILCTLVKSGAISLSEAAKQAEMTEAGFTARMNRACPPGGRDRRRYGRLRPVAKPAQRTVPAHQND